MKKKVKIISRGTSALGIRSQMVYTKLNGESSIGEETDTPVTEIIGEIPSETAGNKENLARGTEPNTVVDEGFTDNSNVFRWKQKRNSC